jgi:outer membrane protein assembly factor BamB
MQFLTNKLITLRTDNIMYKTAALALVALTASCNGQTTFLPGPETKWSTDFLPMGQGTGIVVGPDNGVLYATASDGTIGAMSPSDGSIMWTFKPTTDSTFLNANGEASIAADASYLVYGVTENMGLTEEAW